MALALEFHRGFTSNGGDNSVTIFDTDSLTPIKKVQLQSGTDFILYDPFSKRVFPMNKKITVIAQAGPRASDLDAPSVEDLARNADDRRVIELVVSGTQLGRPLFITPGTPEERVKALRAAFDAMAKDPAFVLAGNKYTNVAPSTGEELDRAIAQVYATPPAIVERLLALNRSQEELERLWKVGYCTCPATPTQMVGRIYVPVFQSGQLVGWQGRRVGDTDWKATGSVMRTKDRHSPKRWGRKFCRHF